jgi:hypothetical protein
MNTNCIDHAPVEFPSTEGKEDITLDRKLAKAQHDLREKGEALRLTTMWSQSSHYSDLAYTAWKQAKTRTAALYSEVKAQQQMTFGLAK